MRSLDQIQDLPSFAVRCWHPCPNTAVVVVEGEIDMATTPQLTAQVREHVRTAEHLVLDLAGVSFLDARGTHALTAAQLNVSDAGGTLQIVGIRPTAARVMRLCGLDPDQSPHMYLLGQTWPWREVLSHKRLACTSDPVGV